MGDSGGQWGIVGDSGDSGDYLVMVVVHTPCNGGCGKDDSTTSGTLSRLKSGCQRCTLSSGMLSGGSRDNRNVL